MSDKNTTYIVYLINLAKSGRHSGFFELCELNTKNVFTVVYRLTGDVNLSKKIVVDTFIAMWDEIKEFNADKPFVDYIKNMAIDFAIIELRKYSNVINEHIDLSTAKTKLELFEKLIMKLPPESKTIFVLHDLEGYSYQMIQKFFPELIVDEIKTILIDTRNSIIRQLEL